MYCLVRSQKENKEVTNMNMKRLLIIALITIFIGVSGYFIIADGEELCGCGCGQPVIEGTINCGCGWAPQRV